MPYTPTTYTTTHTYYTSDVTQHQLKHIVDWTPPGSMVPHHREQADDISPPTQYRIQIDELPDAVGRTVRPNGATYQR